MSFFLLKLVEILLMPACLVTIGLLFSLLLLLRRRRAGLWSLGMVLLLFYLLSIGPVSYLLVSSLRNYIFIPGHLNQEKMDAIVILAGGARAGGALAESAELSGQSWRRFWRGMELYREMGGALPIIYSGGSGKVFDPEPIEPGLARKYALSMGHSPADFILEDGSRNTYENARLTARLLSRIYPGRSHRVFLVTSSIHLPRAVLAFNKAGIEVIPVAGDIPFGRFKLNIFSFIPDAGSFELSTRCIHEWLGIVGYQILGRI